MLRSVLVTPKRRRPVALKSMTIDKLLKLKEEVEHTLTAKISEQRRALEATDEIGWL
jgi:hypothetical protein